MKKVVLAAAAALTLAATAASAVTIKFGFGTTEFSVGDTGLYDISATVTAPSAQIAVFETSDVFTASTYAGGTLPLSGILLNGGQTYYALLTGFANGTEVEVVTTPAVPLPAAAPLLLAAFGGLGFAARRRARKAA